jgi:SET family sugar efflux transporter-like MFS transporter
MGFITPLLTIYLSLHNLSPSGVGEVVSVGSLPSLVTVLLITRLSDVYGRKLLLIIVTLGTAIVSFAFPRADGFWSLLVLVVFYNSLIGSCVAISAAYSVDISHRASYGGGFGKFRVSGSTGWILATAVGGFLADSLGINSIFEFSSLLFVVSTVLVFFVISPPSQTARAKLLSARSGLSLFIRYIKKRELSILFLVLILTNVVQASITYFLPLYLRDSFLVPDSLITLSFTLMAVAEIPGMLYFGALSDKLGRKKVLFLCLAALPLRMALTAALGSAVPILLAQVLQCLTYGGLFVVSMMYVFDSVPPDVRGVFTGLYSTTVGIGSVIGAYVCGVLTAVEGFSGMYFIMAVLSLVALGLFSLPGIHRGKRESMAPSSATQS